MKQKVNGYLDKFTTYFILNFKNSPAGVVEIVIIAY
jgi:hypothetical protein